MNAWLLLGLLTPLVAANLISVGECIASGGSKPGTPTTTKMAVMATFYSVTLLCLAVSLL